MNFVRQWHELQAAEAETGVCGMDSAASTYREACKRLGHELPPMPLAGAKTAYELAKRKASGQPRTMAADASTVSRREQMFPNGNRLYQSF